MLNRQLRIVAFATISVYLFWGRNFSYTGEETHKHVEETPTAKHLTVVSPVCPSCKETQLSPEKAKILAATPMVCPDCKNEISELAVHHCERCGKDVLVCMLCQKATTDLKATTMIGKCPKCKRVRSRLIKGKVSTIWEAKCPDCKHKMQEWFIQHCNVCDVNFLACPICKKEQERFQK